MADHVDPAPQRRPLPPLTRNRARMLRIAIVVWLLIAIERTVSAATGHDVIFSAVMAFASALLSMANWWELRRRSDPARTAGWGSHPGAHP